MSLVSVCTNCSESCKSCSLQTTNCTDCYIDKTYMNNTCILKKCGNNIIEDTEVCDDGNLVSADGCSNLCYLEDTYHCNTSSYNFSTCGRCV